ncbi:MAG: FtsX-like permease family protein [Lachnospiraceae bacterium]
MPQKLSAMKYIKNNKRRVSVLIFSLTLCFVLFYLSHFLLSTTTETFGHVLVENAKKVQYVRLPYSAYGLDSEALESLGEEEFLSRTKEGSMELLSKLEDKKGVQHVFYAPVNYVELYAVVGEYWQEVPMLQKDEISLMMAHFDAKLTEGKLPEQGGEVILDEKIMQNNSYQIGDSLRQYPETKIVGVVQSDNYFGCGVHDGESNLYANYKLVILSDGSIQDMASVLHDMGYNFKDKDADIVDVKIGQKDLQKNIIDAISVSTNVVYIAIMGVLSVALFIVYVTYLRDRRNEWCLYCSIGFSKKSIYYAVMRELLFIFGTAVLLGLLIAAGAVVLLDHTMIQSLGLKCRYLYPEVLVEILCSYALILGALQIPVRVALYKIRTIDAMDDDLIG